ncbi:arad-like aldolase/epimerase [Melanomma pulvis-pyrius CBS 109.77]|uniref:Arad-like aldolase/epimerase n=1 Tax=Melanomma pulvis-pyrius CBS 109.77 TaxID=1314802 RepID=A0A6A6XXQ1_9PLEO|nr:arad-like aldolase/epimerase [Melanomma pulvis-pyrius CBS 109.77]
MPICFRSEYSAAPSRDTNEFPVELRNAIQLLISANHILHYHGLVDAFGHISVRNPMFRNQYILASYNPGAPALVSSAEDFIDYYVSNSEPVFDDQPRGYSERYIHGEIYSRFPHVQCVVHSHSEAVIPFMAARIAVKPVFHMAGFLGVNGPPVLDLSGAYPAMPSYTPDMLIKTPFLGQRLAQKFSHSGSNVSDSSVVLQDKHGFTSIGSNVQQAVYRAIYLQKNCKLLKDAMSLAGGSISKIGYLTQKEAEGCAKMNLMTQDKALRLWLREVAVNPLYRNEEGIPNDLPVGGMQDDA